MNREVGKTEKYIIIITGSGEIAKSVTLRRFSAPHTPCNPGHKTTRSSVNTFLRLALQLLLFTDYKAREL